MKNYTEWFISSWWKNGFNTLYCSSSLAPFAPLYMVHSRNPPPYHNYLYTFNYLASFIFTIEYGLRIAAAPVQYASCKHAWKARLRYIISFYGIIDCVAILPFVVISLYKETPHVHLVVLAYVLIIFKLIRYSRSFQMIGTVLKLSERNWLPLIQPVALC